MIDLSEMEQVITAKLKLHLNKEQKQSLLETLAAFNNSMNHLLQVNYNDKSTSVKTIHKNYYHQIRNEFNLPSQLACAATRAVSNIYKTLWTRFKSQKDKAVLNKIPHYNQLTANYTLNRDITIKLENMECSITTIDGRLKNVKLTGWNQHYKQIKQGKLCDPKITYDKRTKIFYLLLPVSLEIQEQKPKQIVGIDAGQRTTLTCVSTTNEIKIYNISEAIRERKAKLSKQRGTLMSKGTRPSRRKLLALKGRERRLISDVSHCISKSVVSDFQGSKLIMEDLTNIRSNTKTYRKDKEQRRQVEQWNFAEMQFKMCYKSILYNGIESIKVNPAYTSQKCPVCLSISSKNRVNGSKEFKCINCGHEEDADIVGSRNILSTGLLVNQPNGSLSVNVRESLRIPGTSSHAKAWSY